MSHYAISVADPRPAMTETYTFAECDTYAEAVAAAHSMFRITGRRVALFSAHPPRKDGSQTPTTHYWHRITPDGQFTDRNTNSGVATAGRVIGP